MTGPVLLEDVNDALLWMSLGPSIVGGFPVQSGPIPPVESWIDREPGDPEDMMGSMAKSLGF